VLSKLQKNSTKSRGILNALSLTEFLLKNGSSKFRKEMDDELFMIKRYRNYIEDDDDEDLVGPIKALSQKVTTLIEDREVLEQARIEANSTRDRIRGFSNDLQSSNNSYQDDPKYGGISSESFQYDPQSDNNLSKKLGLDVQTSEGEREASHSQKNDLANKLGVITNSKQVGDTQNKFDSTSGKEALKSNNEKKDEIQSSNLDDDFLGLSVSKPKGITKLLPAPPKKRLPGDKELENSPNSRKLNDVNQKKDDFNLLLLNESDPPMINQVLVNKKVDNNDDFDFLTGSVNPAKPVLQDPVFEMNNNILDPSNTVSTNKNIPVSKSIEIDFTDFDSITTNGKSDHHFLEVGVPKIEKDVKTTGKTFGKLPPPPKRPQNVVNKGNNDFLI
jgi:hypothetical protein